MIDFSGYFGILSGFQPLSHVGLYYLKETNKTTK